MRYISFAVNEQCSDKLWFSNACCLEYVKEIFRYKTESLESS